jgi:hypothetical protein
MRSRCRRRGGPGPRRSRAYARGLLLHLAHRPDEFRENGPALLEAISLRRITSREICISER